MFKNKTCSKKPYLNQLQRIHYHGMFIKLKRFENNLTAIKVTINIELQICCYMKTSQLICSANLLTGFYIMTTLAFNELSALV